MKKIIIAFFSLIAIGFGIIAYSFWQSNTIVTMAYHNPDYGFTINTPEGVTVINNRDDIGNSGYIPVCDPDTSVVCLIFPDTTYPGSNFDNAGVSVNVLTDLTTDAACKSPSIPFPPEYLQTVQINGVAFTKYAMGEAAMSHSSSGQNYRAFHGDKCFELTTRIYQTTYEVYEPGTIKEFTSEQELAITAKMDAMAQSFKFEE